MFGRLNRSASTMRIDLPAERERRASSAGRST